MECVKKSTATEMKQIEGGVTDKRPGGASGVCLHSNKCHSFSKVTQKDSTLHTASSVTGVNMKATYLNNKGQVKTCNHGYNPIYMSPLNTQQKTKRAQQDNAYRSILQHTVLCYLKAMVCLESAGIPSVHSKKYYLNKFRQFASRGKSL